MRMAIDRSAGALEADALSSQFLNCRFYFELFSADS